MGHDYEERPQENKIILRPLSLITKGYVHWAAAIMIRLETAFMELQREQHAKQDEEEDDDRRRRGCARHPGIPLLTRPPNVENRLARLLQDVILGYDSNIPERKKVDPDTYAAEVRRSESARLSVQLDTDKILEEVGQHWMTCHPEAGFTEPPIFVVPVIYVDFGGGNRNKVSEAHSFLHTQRLVLDFEESEMDKVR